MSDHELDRFVENLLNGKPTEPMRIDESDAPIIRTAIELRAERGDTGPSPDFIAKLGAELAAASSKPKRRGVTRRDVIVGTSIAAASAAAGVSIDRRLIRKPPNSSGGDQQSTLEPTNGSWQLVAVSTELPEGGVRSFDLGSVNGFVHRTNGQVQAVSGICTHQGCHLFLDAPSDRLRCPCHLTSFSPEGQVVEHQLPATPPPLPRFEVRESNGNIEVFAPGQ